MSNWAQLETYTAELVAAVKTLTAHCRNAEATTSDLGEGTLPQPLVPVDAPIDVHRARGTIVANIAKLQALLIEPPDFLQDLAKQNQLLACIKWLGEFQVLACIPLRGSVSVKDVAELVGVPATQLCRIVRMTATAGFLSEPRPSHVAHSALSAPFVTKPSYLDAVMFLAETAAPAALQMAAATQRFGGGSQKSHESAYNVAHNTSVTFASMCEHQLKLQRQWPAYFRYAMGGTDTSVTDIITCFDWLNLGNAVVVEVGARSTSTALALAELYPALHFVVQISEPPSPTSQLTRESISNGWDRVTPAPETRIPSLWANHNDVPSHLNSRITVERRVLGTSQNVEGAAVYVIRLPSPSPMAPSRSLHAQVISELKAHLVVLRANSHSRLILTAGLLLESGIMNSKVAAMAFLRDLSLLQLANDHELEISEVMKMLNSVRDSTGRLVLVDKLRTWDNATIGLNVRYQAYDSPQEF